MIDMNQLETELKYRFVESIRLSRELGYHPTVFADMVNTLGALATAKKLVKTSAVQSGFKSLLKLGRLDLSMEAIMLEEIFIPLFTENELIAAKWRLDNPNLV